MEIRGLSDLYWKVSPRLFYLSVLMAGLVGACYAALIPFLLYSLDVSLSRADEYIVERYTLFNSPTEKLALCYFALCGAIMLLRSLSAVCSLSIAQRAAAMHKAYLYRRIIRSPLSNLEKIGEGRLTSILNFDIPYISGAANLLPTLCVNMLTILGTLLFLAYLSSKLFWFVVGALALVMLTYQLPTLLSRRYYRAARQDQDLLQENVAGLVRGVKDLKLSPHKAEDFLTHDLVGVERHLMANNMKAGFTNLFAQSYGEIAGFLVVGVVVFHFQYDFDLRRPELLGLIAAVLYLSGPVGLLMNSSVALLQARVSLARLQALYRELTLEDTMATQPLETDWQALTVQDLSYSHSGRDDELTICGISLQFPRGQVSFIVGGNGSGKSTLAKCLSLHYQPAGGQIRFDQQVVDSSRRDLARQRISAIYSDFHLFSRVLGGAAQVDGERLARYLSYLELDGVVSVSHGLFSSVNLSDGQRRRLALLLLLLDDREICIFDEWAADQDPRFKNVFYHVILSDLKACGKVVIVISHDDRYFGVADQLITMENGMVRSVEAGRLRPVAADGDQVAVV